MPQVKIAYVVSFSSEDSENQARNLLSSEESKRRWLCARGDSTASAVLQLERAVTISAVHIGAHQAALVEVLVARSESPTEPFQVLVPSSVFLTPRESRGGAGAPGAPGAPGDRVRLFEGAALAEGARSQRWDRVRIVCSQPYNKHCKYGISFINIFEPAPAPAPAPAVPPRLSVLDTFSSDEYEFRPGELFAKLRQSTSNDTGAQIRQATSQALKNNLDAATKLVKVPLSKNRPTATAASTDSEELQHTQRDKDNLMYTEDDERPHKKIDHIVQRHKDDKSKDVANTSKPEEKPKEKDKIEKENTFSSKKEHPSGSGYSEGKGDRDRSDSGKERSDNKRRTDSSAKEKDESRKRSYKDRNARGSSPAELPLSGVLFVMSGYENPERARLRDLGLSLGARASRDWGPACTHLICAFANTPKLRAVRAGRGGADVPCVRGTWLQACARAGRRVPWRPHAVDADPRAAHDDDDECDTDDEIEKVLRQGKKPRTGSPTPQTPDAARGSDDDEVEFVKDERMQGNITIEESDEADTDAETTTGARERISAAATLPALFAGRSFVLETSLLAPLDAPLLARYCRAYGGLVLTPSEVDLESGPHYELCASLPTASSTSTSTSTSGSVRVRADWVWECHAARKLLPLDDYV